MGAITRELARLHLAIGSQRAGTYFVLQGGGLQVSRYVSVGKVGFICGLLYLLGRQRLVFSCQCGDDLRYYGVYYLTSQVYRRSGQSAYLGVSRLSLVLCDEVSLRS